MNNRVVLQGIITYPHIFDPVKNTLDLTKPPEFSLNLLIDKSADLTVLYEVIERALDKTFGAGKRPKSYHRFLKDCDLLENSAEYEKGKWKMKSVLPYISISKTTSKETKNSLIICDLHNKILENKGDITSGDIVNISIEVFGYDTPANKGVTTRLKGVQLVSKAIEPITDTYRNTADALFGSVAEDHFAEQNNDIFN